MQNAVFIFMPVWNTDSHNYTIALFESLTRDSGLEFRGADLNSELYHSVSTKYKKMWEVKNYEDWYLPELCKTLFNDNQKFLKDFFARLIDSETAVCGISVRNESLPFSYLCAQHIRKLHPNLPIIFGGPACFEECHYTKILQDEWSITAIVAGEGEHAWTSYLKDIQSSAEGEHNPGQIPGMIYRLKSGELLNCGKVDKIKDLSSLPILDYNKLNSNNLSRRSYALETSRGCVNHCAFCSERNNYFPYRTKSSNRIFQEIVLINEHFLQQKQRHNLDSLHIEIVDSVINGDINIFEEWLDMIISKKIHFTWSGMAILRKEMTLPLLKKMKMAGCQSIMWGMESGSSATLQHMNKRRFTLDLAERIFIDAHSVGILQRTNFIIGFPTETEQDFIETLNFVKKIQPLFDTITCSAMLILPNAPIYHSSDEYGIDDPTRIESWTSLDGKNTLSIREDRIHRFQSILTNVNTFTARKLSTEKSFL